MAYIIPENLLQYQVCSTCQKYLSYTPTKVYRTGEIKCGRCSHSDDGGTVSTFETLARNMIFPCVNRIEGCTKLLQYMDVKEHEKNCVGSVVECPICLTEQFSVLSLINHFNLKHPNNVLKNCVIDVSLLKQFTEYFLNYDLMTNSLYVLILQWDAIRLSVNCAAVIDSKDDRRTPTIQAAFFTDDDEEVRLHVTNIKDCLDLKYYLLDVSQEGLIYNVPLQLMSIRCKVTFDCTQQFSKMEPFFPIIATEFQKKILPKMYLDSEFKKTYKSLDLNKFKISSCGLKMLHNNFSLQIACDFCHNVFASSGFIKDVYYDTNNWYICGTCHSRGITKSLKNKGADLTKLGDVGYNLLNFYCKFGCKKFFRGGELLLHEDQCSLNPQRLLSEEDFVKSYFGAEFVKGSKCNKENVISFVPNKFKGTGKVFVATRDNFKYIIDYEQDTKLKVCAFHVNHSYDTRQYYTLVHKWENMSFTTTYNDFTMKLENGAGPSLFAINLKELKDDIEVFFDS